MSYQVLEENFLSGSPLTQDRKDCRPKFYIGDDLTHNRIRITKVRDFEEKKNVSLSPSSLCHTYMCLCLWHSYWMCGSVSLYYLWYQMSPDASALQVDSILVSSSSTSKFSCLLPRQPPYNIYTHTSIYTLYTCVYVCVCVCVCVYVILTQTPLCCC